jgi:hypothetical protein
MVNLIAESSKGKGKLTIYIETIKFKFLSSIKHSIGRHDACYSRKQYSDGRQNASSFCASIVKADRVHDAIGWNTLTADRIPDAAGWNIPTDERVPATNAEILRQPTEYFRSLRKHCDGQESTRCDRKEHYNSRQSAQCDRMEYFDGRQSTCHNR